MKTHVKSSLKKGFTLMELMVAMAITTIIVSVLVSVTSMALDTWNRSRAELRASRQAKAMIDTMARDFESLVTRKGNLSEWLSAQTPPAKIGENLESTNSAELMFFTAVTDRYNGNIGAKYPNNVGDVSFVAYELSYKDPMSTGTSSKFKTFVLNRLLVNPDDTFKDLLGKDDLISAFGKYKANLANPESFVCENIFQFSVTFNVQVSQTSGSGASAKTTIVNVPVTIGDTNSSSSSKTFRINGAGIDTEVTGGTVTAVELAAGRVTSLEIAVTVVSDFGMDQLRSRKFDNDAKRSEFLRKNSYEYTKVVQLSSM
jgi:prepilin-type N-terminal cleavage/methylation domain-containing protein